LKSHPAPGWLFFVVRAKKMAAAGCSGFVAAELHIEKKTLCY